jgi:hypothetical protein
MPRAPQSYSQRYEMGSLLPDNVGHGSGVQAPPPEPSSVADLLATPMALRLSQASQAVVSPRTCCRTLVAVVRWLCVATVQAACAAGLTIALRELFFSRAGDECAGPVLSSCLDDEGWRWARDRHQPCSSFAVTSMATNESLHDFCDVAKSAAGVPAKQACRTSCTTCSWAWYFEFIVAGAPIWARNALIVAALVAGCSKISGFERRPGLLANLLVGPTETAGDCDHKAGWAAIAGLRLAVPGEQPQAKWAEACEARSLTQRQLGGLVGACEVGALALVTASSLSSGTMGLQVLCRCSRAHPAHPCGCGCHP